MSSSRHGRAALHVKCSAERNLRALRCASVGPALTCCRGAVRTLHLWLRYRLRASASRASSAPSAQSTPLRSMLSPGSCATGVGPGVSVAVMSR